MVSGVRLLARMSGETLNSFGCDSSLNVAAAVATGAPPDAGSSFAPTACAMGRK